MVGVPRQHDRASRQETWAEFDAGRRAAHSGCGGFYGQDDEAAGSLPRAGFDGETASA
jgi:hypothetical protein